MVEPCPGARNWGKFAPPDPASEAPRRPTRTPSNGGAIFAPPAILPMALLDAIISIWCQNERVCQELPKNPGSIPGLTYNPERDIIKTMSRSAIAFTRHGRAKRGLAILWHGLGSNSQQYVKNGWPERIASHGYEVICPDLPGHGATPPLRHRSEYGIANLANTMRSFINEALATHSMEHRILWIAHSMTTVISCEAFTTYKELRSRISKVVLMSPPLVKRVNPIYTTPTYLKCSGYIDFIPSLIMDTSIRDALPAIIQKMSVTADVQRIDELSTRYRPTVRQLIAWMRYLEANPQTVRHLHGALTKYPAELMARTIVLQGSEDEVFPARDVRTYTDFLVRGGATYREISGAGHALIDDQSEQALNSVLEYTNEQEVG
jgi:pimeloyl-ACP methyl ester carboxylesterase